MNDNSFKLRNAPIVEAVLDIECDMPPPFRIASIFEAAGKAFADQYPKVRRVLSQTHELVVPTTEDRKVSIHQEVEAVQFSSEDEKQVVQLRKTGYSFNRLAPYSSLDDYLPEIERTWSLFVHICAPVEIRAIRLRYVNRLLIPLEKKRRVELNDYFRIAPQLPDNDTMTILGFFNQSSAVENASGKRVDVVLTAQAVEAESVPVILDITAASQDRAAPKDRTWLLNELRALRVLKNRVFKQSLTERCLRLFQ